MDYKGLFKDSFSELTPLSDSKEICTNVMERAKNMSNKNRKIKRTAIAVIAAAAVLAAATVTVGAVSGWDFNSAFSRIFNKQEETSTPAQTVEATVDITVTDTVETNESADTFDFKKYGKQLDLWYDFESYRLNIKGISADRTTAYILYDVIFDDTYDGAPKEGWTDWEFIVHMDALEDGEAEAPLNRVYRSHCELISHQDDTLSYYGMMCLSDINDTLEGKTITLDFNDLYRLIPNTSEKDPEPWKERELLTCGLHVDIPVDFKICSESNEIVINESIELREYNESMEMTTAHAEVKSIKLTPFNWELFIEMDTSDFEKGDGYLVDITITLTDGTQLLLSDYSFGHSENGSLYHGTFTRPISPTAVESVTVAQHVSRTAQMADLE